MDDIDKIKSQVNRYLCHDYSGNPDDGDGFNDRLWINKNQKYEVAYAIAKCLSDCNAPFLATDAELVRYLEEIIQEMKHDNLGRCKREEAYPILKHEIAVRKLVHMILFRQLISLHILRDQLGKVVRCVQSPVKDFPCDLLHVL